MKTQYLISTGAGWRIIGDRLEEARRAAQDASIEVVPYTPSATLRHLTWHTGYHSQTPRHAALMDPFTANKIQFVSRQRKLRKVDAVVAATQAQAAPLAFSHRSQAVHVFLDATRNLYREEFGAAHIKDRWIQKEGELFKRVRHIFSLSAWAADDITEAYGIEPERITVIPPLVAHRPLPHLGPVAGDLLNVVFIGNDFERKGGRELLSWHQQYLRDEVRLHIVGNTPSIAPSENVVLHGPQLNSTITQTLLPRMDVICHPTNRDCSSIVVAEAAMAGVPAVVSDVGGVGELVVDGVTGFRAQPSDPATFLTRLQGLARDRSLLARMRLATHQHAAETFSAHLALGRMQAVVAAG